jgi:hypothetical protein
MLQMNQTVDIAVAPEAVTNKQRSKP